MFVSQTAAIYGVAGHALTGAETAFLRDTKPVGIILFARNIESKTQVKALTDSLYELLGEELLILVDQEGGRVRRLRPPIWPDFPPAGDFFTLYQNDPERAKRAVFINYQLIAACCAEIGLNVDCAPMLDIRFEGYHDIVGDRAFGDNTDAVIVLGRAAMEGLLQGGVLPVIKHIPGHGRAMVDSHEDLPVADASLEILRETDFVPFHQLRDAPFGMTAHIRYTAIDADHCATLSKPCIDLIRDEIDFNGCLMTDDLSMKALSGSFEDRVTQSLEAGCDLMLHCNGEMQEMEAVARATPVLGGQSLHRLRAAWQQLGPSPALTLAALTEERDSLLTA